MTSSTDITPSRPSPWLADAAMALIVFLVYATVALSRYGFMDDYPILASALRHDGTYFKMNMSMGRPVAAWAMDGSFSMLNNVADLRWLRLLSVIGFGAAAVVLRRVASRAGWDLPSACCLALLLVMLPGVQVYICWTALWFYPYIICLVAGALLILDSQYAASGGVKMLLAAALAMGLLIIAGLAYQPMLFFYISLFMLRYWATPQKPGCVPWRTAALHGAVAGVALCICFCIFKFGAQPSARGSFPVDPAGKIGWFFKEPLPYALNLININIFAHPWMEIIAGITGLVILGGSLRAFKSSRGLWRLLVLPLAMAASFAPSMIVMENWPSFRSGYPLFCTALVAFMWGLHQLLSNAGPRGRQAWHLAAVALTITACILARTQVQTLFAQPQQDEFNLLKQRLAAMPLKAGDHVALVQPALVDSGTWIQLYGEFGYASSLASWVHDDMFWLALRETHPELNGNDVKLTTVWLTPSPEEHDFDYVVDMKKMLYLFRR